MIYFTSDSHYSHSRIIQHCNRPFSSVEEMDEKLIEYWNDVVGKRDTVYHLGDFAMIPKQKDETPRMKLYRKLRFRLNGRILLCLGNHDHMSQDVYDCFTEVFNLKTIKIDKQKITLCHYPMRSWDGSYSGKTFHAYGHCHNRLESSNDSPSCDVGVDVPDWNYRPVEWSVLREKLLKKKEIFLASKGVRV